MYIFDQAVPATDIWCFTPSSYAEFIANEADTGMKLWLSSSGFSGKAGAHTIVPSADGGIAMIILVLTEEKDAFWQAGSVAKHLPSGAYRYTRGVDPEQAFLVAMAWGLSVYRFEYFVEKSTKKPAELVVNTSIDAHSLDAFVTAITQVRDLINLPANALGPEVLAQEAALVAETYGASFRQVVGEDLLTKNFPAIHTVGRASVRAPRLIELNWGPKNGMKLALVGKGVCFDSGGLDIKSAVGMREMKKDMGGAAHVLGLARLIMAHQLPISLQVLIPAVDNVISGNAYMPGDIVSTRAGISVENDNTDAEGRLILSDALQLACESKPDLIIDFATLTGAARIGLGPDLPAMFANDNATATAVLASADAVSDPIWHMPLFAPYRAFIKSKLADVRSCGNSGGYGGAITAALFLEKFIQPGISWLHFDIMAANTRDLPGRPEGGEAMGLRALFNFIARKVASS